VSAATEACASRLDARNSRSADRPRRHDAREIAAAHRNRVRRARHIDAARGTADAMTARVQDRPAALPHVAMHSLGLS